ncbi:UDP-Glc/Gal endoplasmic reticulum nucleotide sugar transporter-like protein [Lojkania enalia]|uniref:UDP-galactose transporter homolog 1 n=1 Tax=Lojkania enalia TaxID=147567 RepID=A0A9P4KES8_9PLEO|nr:UDP-Glc/Gal endoplasmic reticulum nucleotide sugar transporter-like protein [Didymosphaeria enalia]
MARAKQAAPIQRTPSETYAQANGTTTRRRRNSMIEMVEKEFEETAEAYARDPEEQKEGGYLALTICVGGIYASFLSWGYLQERITTTPYGPNHSRFTYPVFLNTIQSILAAIVGYIYHILTSPRDPKTSSRRVAPIFPSRSIFLAILAISITSSLASPFGYASLKHIDYVTFILAKSCKLLPVMFLHITLFQKRYPVYKYLVVAAVTLGVAIFTLHNPSTAKKAAKKAANANPDASNALGLFLLGINLLFDGLTNTIQDEMFQTLKGFNGAQMMCAQNLVSSALTIAYLLITPFLSSTPLASWIGLGPNGGELREAIDFVTTYPAVGWDVLAFGACGAIGQVFIFRTLAHFSSLLLVTVTVTRKMLTMLLSIVLFGHHITHMQWLGVGLVFGGIGAEALYKRQAQMAKDAKEAEKMKNMGRKKEL